MPTHQKSFDRVNDILKQSNKVFVVPLLQRPYAWDETQVQQLLDDIDTGSRRKPSPFHYLSPIHVVEIDSCSQNEWLQYVDQSNEDVAALNQANFRSDDGSAIRVYLIIDGQQRLTTLFNLFWNMNRAGLTLNCNGITIPRIILNPINDHYAFRKMLGLPTKSAAYVSKAQHRLIRCLSKSIDSTYWPFVTGKGFELLQVELDVHYALQAFQTQNDRGKSLVTIEKLKSLIMEYDLNLNCGVLYQTHAAFSQAYQTLDKPGCYCTEDEFIQILSVFARIPNSTDCLYQTAEAGYGDYFAPEPKKNPNTPQLLEGWIGMTATISCQLDRIDIWLNKPSPLPSCIMPTVATRTVSEDYAAILKSLKLNIRNVAVLCKFSEIFPTEEWHSKVATVLTGNVRVVPILESRRIQAKGNSTGELPKTITDKIDELGKRIDALREPQEREISVLEVVERMQLFTLALGSSYPGGFKNYWNAAFKEGNSIQDAIKMWYEFATAYNADNRERFIGSLFDPFLNETIKCYLLREFEFCCHGDNIHFNKSLQVEHIFPQEPTISKPPLGYFQPPIVTSVDYDAYVAILGNQMYLDGSLNSSIKRDLPPIKADAYFKQANNTIVVPFQNRVKSAIAVGNDFNMITDSQHYRTYLDIRTLEFAVFAAERFF